MKLIVEGVSPKREKVYQDAFRKLCEWLKISTKDYTVLLKFYQKRPKIVRDVYGTFASNEGGCTYSEIVDGVLLVNINDYKTTTDNRDELNVVQPAMKTFCHEMVHVAQMVHNQLVVDINRQKVWWRGKQLPDMPDYKDMPWEHEADDLTPILYQKMKEHFNVKKDIRDFRRKENIQAPPDFIQRMYERR